MKTLHTQETELKAQVLPLSQIDGSHFGWSLGVIGKLTKNVEFGALGSLTEEVSLKALPENQYLQIFVILQTWESEHQDLKFLKASSTVYFEPSLPSAQNLFN